MRNKTNLFFSIFFIINGYSYPLLSLENKIQKGSFIPTDYLQTLPINDYIIDPGDRLFIRVSRIHPELNTFAIVDGEGTIYLPKLKRVYINKLSINELNDLLNEAFKKFVKFPSVEVEISSYRSLQVFVKGEVESPGIQVLDGLLSLSSLTSKQLLNSQQNNEFITSEVSKSEDIRSYFPTVFDALRSSGGITQFSDLSNIQIIRNEKLSKGGGKITTNLNFEKVLLFGDTSQNIRIYDGDIIIVNRANEANTNLLTKSILSKLSPKFLKVFVSGRVNRPGSITLSKASQVHYSMQLDGWRS